MSESRRGGEYAKPCDRHSATVRTSACTTGGGRSTVTSEKGRDGGCTPPCSCEKICSTIEQQIAVRRGDPRADGFSQLKTASLLLIVARNSRRLPLGRRLLRLHKPEAVARRQVVVSGALRRQTLGVRPRPRNGRSGSSSACWLQHTALRYGCNPCASPDGQTRAGPRARTLGVSRTVSSRLSSVFDGFPWMTHAG